MCARPYADASFASFSLDHDPGSISRAEKKARKAMSKLGMEKVENVDRVTLRRGRNLLYVISNPDCFKAPDPDRRRLRRSESGRHGGKSGRASSRV